MEKATRQFIKEHNRNLVLQTIFSHDHISRAQIARLSRLTRTTVSDIVAGLIQEGLVSETGYGQSQGGKNPILLSLVDDSRWIIALDLGQKQFRGAIVNLRGKIQDVITMPVDDRDGVEALDQVFQMLDWLVSRSSHKLHGIGVGAPGLINTNAGMVVKAVNLNWNNVPLTKLLEERYHLPAYILNDCQAAAIGEKSYNNRFRNSENLVLIKLHNGIGSGIIINGSIYQGDGGFAGEIGHIVSVPEGGELCRCGRRGCLETVASTQALIRQVQSEIDKFPQSLLASNSHGITIDSIEAAFNAGDPFVRDLVFQTAHFVGAALSSLVGLLNIHAIVLSGSMTRFGSPWLETIQREMAKYSLDLPMQKTRVEIGQLGENATILGAAAVFVNNYSYLFVQ
jgi:glucokinase-like ROK family protein